MSLEKFPQGLEGEKVAEENESKTLLERLDNYKRAFALSLSLSALGTSFDTVNPQEVHAGFSSDEETIESSAQDMKLLESKKFVTKDGHQAVYIEGEVITVIDGKKFDIHLMNITVTDEDVVYGDNTHTAKFSRYFIDNKEIIDAQTSYVLRDRGIGKNPYTELSLTKKMSSIPNAGNMLKNNLTKIYSETILLTTLQEAGKDDTSEYRLLKQSTMTHIKNVIDRYGTDAINELAFEEMVGK